METTTETYDQALAAVVAARLELADWDRRRRAAEDDVAALDGLAGAQILDDPEASAEIEGRIGRAQAIVRAASRALEEQRSRLLAAEAGLFAAAAASAAIDAAAAEAAVEKHDATSRRLRQKLEEHEEVAVQSHWLAHTPARNQLIDAAWRAADRQGLLEQLATGVHPDKWIAGQQAGVDTAIHGRRTTYPESVAVEAAQVPVDDFLARCARARAAYANVEGLHLDVEHRILEREEQLAAQGMAGDLAGDFVWSSLRSQLESLSSELSRQKAVLGAILPPPEPEPTPDGGDLAATAAAADLDA